MGKKLFLVLLPAATLLSPLALYKAPRWWSEMTASVSSHSPTNASQQRVGASSEQPAAGDTGMLAVGDAPIHDLADVLRFDVSPRWVVDRWPRVSAGLSQLQLQGYRVPLVTGTAEDDLAGALTYYFSPQQHVERLTFRGTTGNARKIVHLLSTRYGFSRRVTNHPGVVLYERPGHDGKPASFLWIRPAGVVKSSEPLERFEVALLMERA